MSVKILMPNVNPKSFIDDYLQKMGIEYPRSYMNATRCHLEEPSRYTNIDEATKRLKMAIDGKQKVGIIQDCDVDGLCSAVIAYQFLKSNGVWPIVFFHSGKQHGINDLMPEILNANLDLLIVPDASGKPEECKTLRANGCDVIIADHHEIENENQFAIVVNCMQGDTNHAVSGTTVMAKIVDRYCERYFSGRRFNFEDLVALSLLSDSCSMLSIENRAYLNLGFGGVGTMKTGYIEYDAINESSTKIETNLITSGDIIVIKEDCGIYNIIFRKPLLNDKNKVCGNVYVHAPNCTLGDDGKYIVHGADESRTTIAYHQLCDLAKVSYDTSCGELFKALNKTIYPDGYKSNLNRVEGRGGKK